MSTVLARTAAALALLLLLCGCGQGDQYAGTVPTAARKVGSCAKIATPEELYTASDIGPVVPCTEPHQTETVFVGRLDGPIAAEAERPVVEKLDTVIADRCHSVDLRGYLGARARDSFGVSLLTRVPTRAEWAAGERTFRCDAIPAAAPGAPPQLSVPLRGVLPTAASAAVRVCWRGGEQLPCDRPHTAEEVNAWLLAAPGSPEQPCEPYVTEFLGGPLSDFPELAVVAIPGIVNGQQTVKCAVGRRDGRQSTGTLAVDARS
ncbi:MULTISPECIES: septum formation family protein [Actinomycetes]|uniref:septum formation family protein n=1 Tax=Actinomycetes TaxID=1760 RepID=UPI0001B54090|nr:MULTISPECIES: septum formation family protein [Actinomycetes]EFL09983.1 hypothetical protein SSMG_05654 [Streptomyces sp. AA4]